jgi:hypothetical protein
VRGSVGAGCGLGRSRLGFELSVGLGGRVGVDEACDEGFARERGTGACSGVVADKLVQSDTPASAQRAEDVEWRVGLDDRERAPNRARVMLVY